MTSSSALNKRIQNNKRQLAKLGIEFSIFEPTATGLRKSILDATQPVRTHFELESFHFYWEQKQGPEYKVTTPAVFLTDNNEIASTASFYRPVTKNGDPRMWFKSLPSYAIPEEQIAIIIKNKTPYLLNLNQFCIESSLNNPTSSIKAFLGDLSSGNNVANELLGKLREISQAPFKAQRKGDTAIGYTLELLLGIKANSSKQPDYKGIELKSGRGVKTRTTLFAQVANWTLSPCKRSADILEKYGYARGEDFKLYCTVSSLKENSQGLGFVYDEKSDLLIEMHRTSEVVAIWPGKLLRERLKEKHAETFWIEAESISIDGVEHFNLTKVTHTKSPITSQLMPLIASGVITMDHLIKKNSKGRVSEKGPLFKMNKKDLDLLFPTPVEYAF